MQNMTMVVTRSGGLISHGDDGGSISWWKCDVGKSPSVDSGRLEV
jgi:hypothetical protein